MSNQPQIIYGMPIIVTKDRQWLDTYAKVTKAEPGAIWILPEDAILIVPPEITGEDKAITRGVGERHDKQEA